MVKITPLHGEEESSILSGSSLMGSVRKAQVNASEGIPGPGRTNGSGGKSQGLLLPIIFKETCCSGSIGEFMGGNTSQRLGSIPSVSIST